MKLTVRPLLDREWVGAAPRTGSQFTASWPSTLDLLEREVYALQWQGMDDPIVMVDVTEADVRRDGQLRANARPASDAVAVAFESKRGPLIFRADRYSSMPYGSKMDRLWQHNVRAIALTLEALRAVNRYGATQSGEQYVGYRQIESRPRAMDAETARSVLVGYGPVDAENLRVTLRRARRSTHPDSPKGSREAWDLVEQAARVLGVQSS